MAWFRIAPDCPPIIRLLGRVFYLALAAAIVIAPAIVIASRYYGFWNSGVFGGLLPVFVFVPQFVAMGYVIWRTRAYRRLWRESGGRLCTGCAHSLAGLDDRGRCPECGADFDTTFDRLSWRSAGMDRLPDTATP